MSENTAKDEFRVQRTSLYLVKRADALLGALRFFAMEKAADASRRRLQFLAQSDYWEWEVDNLIYSFTNLAERRETWRSPYAASQKLTRLGIVVKAKLFRNSRWIPAEERRIYPGRWSSRMTAQSVAPVEMLQQVIELWNSVVDLVEAEFVTPMKDNVEKWNVQARSSLAQLREEMPALEEMVDEGE